MFHRFLPVFPLFAAAAIAACAAPARSIDHPSSCKEQITIPCVSGSVCVEDEARGCEICKCTAPPFVPFDRKGPPGTIEVQKDDPESPTHASADATSSGAAEKERVP